MYPSQETDPDHGTGVVIEQTNIRACLKLLFGTISTLQAAPMALLSPRFRCPRGIQVPARWCCFSSPSLGGDLGGATFPLSPVGWCCLAYSSFGWGCFSLCFCVLLPSFSSFGWGCFLSLFCRGAALPPPSFVRDGICVDPPLCRGTSQGVFGSRIIGLVCEGETVGKTGEVDEMGERELVLVVSVRCGKE